MNTIYQSLYRPFSSMVRTAICLTAVLAALTGTALAQPPGDPAPTGKPPTQGSVLVYNYYTSALPFSSEDTFFELTNNHKSTGVFAHLFFVDGSTCAPADAFVCLPPDETINFLASDLVPVEKGYLWAIATDSNGVPINHNFLSGHEEVMMATGHRADFDALAIPAVAAVPTTATPSSSEATINFDDIHYARVPRVVELEPVYSVTDGHSTLLIVNRLGGSLSTGVTGIGTIFGFLTNLDIGNPYSFVNSGTGCQLNRFLSNAFPRVASGFSTVLPSKQEGNMKLWAITNYGLSGAVLRHNSDKKAKKYNSGDNLRAVTVTSASLVVPVFVPAC